MDVHQITHYIQIKKTKFPLHKNDIVTAFTWKLVQRMSLVSQEYQYYN